jgi:hypothetical protein
VTLGFSLYVCDPVKRFRIDVLHRQNAIDAVTTMLGHSDDQVVPFVRGLVQVRKRLMQKAAYEGLLIEAIEDTAAKRKMCQ